ncbi:polysaccharide biosynthesis/export family protein [Winogradskyella sp. PE311]|uniref:polysaccharide biosynthesis/export family protein n=1 Tax=Winogradskyella sp. PE311 TaxID=3366943 RepID=UPI00397F3773
MKFKIITLLSFVILASCVSKKEILYLQDVDVNSSDSVNYQSATIQPNDILKIVVESIVPEAAIPYNKNSAQSTQPQNIELMQLDGYLVSINNTIGFPVLGKISTDNKTPSQLEEEIKSRLINEGHLANPSVHVRLLNAKVTILGEVNEPGTYNFTENSITILQAFGYAGDLTINGQRDDILITREVDGVRRISHIDLTTSAFMNTEFYFIKPNDVIVVNPNNPKVKTAGFIGDVGTILTIASLALSITILLSR